MTAVMRSSAGASRQVPSRIILHAMAEIIRVDRRSADQLGIEAGDYHAADFLLAIGLSAHRLVLPSGEDIKMREDHEGAYHAKGFNDDSLGIEFLVPGTHDYASFLRAMKTPYLPDPAYWKGVHIVSDWVSLHGIGQIDTHSKVDPKRKHDPGEGFPLEQFLSEVLP